MLTVNPDPVLVESQLQAGTLSCPSCEGVLSPWGWARPRMIGRGDGRRRVHPRRSCCRVCKGTHVLLPAVMLLRRCDWVEVIGQALALRAAGWAQRPIAARVGVARSTLRGWLSRFVRAAGRVRAHFTVWALWLDPGLVRLEPSASTFADAVAAVAAAAEAARRGLGVTSGWQFASMATTGRLLAPCNTTAPFPAPWTG